MIGFRLSSPADVGIYSTGLQRAPVCNRKSLLVPFAMVIRVGFNSRNRTMLITREVSANRPRSLLRPTH